MAVICPTVTETNASPHDYRSQLDRISGFADRIQIDLMDGEFAPSRSINLVQVWWPEGIQADIHLMYKQPVQHIETLVSLRPSLVIIHAEAEGDLGGMITHLKKFGIKMGVALLQDTKVNDTKELIRIADHVLLFSGDLGFFGGEADLRLLDKVKEVKSINPKIEIGWDGGANERNVASLAHGGIDVINVGGAIQKAADPEEAYATLVSKIT